MINFSIQHISTWEVQSIAGSIIPAIAATNSIVAASQIIQLIHLLKMLRSCNKNITREVVEKSNCRHVWIKSNVLGSTPLLKGHLTQSEPLEQPNPICTTCQQKSIKLRIKSLDDWPISKFVKKVFIDKLGLNMVNIDFNLRNIYDSEEYADNEYYATQLDNNTISFYGIEDKSILTVTDINEILVQFEIVIEYDPDLDDPNGFCIIGNYK